MTPFQAIKATFYMLLAKAREPIQDNALIPAPTGAPHRGSGAAHAGQRRLEMTQSRRRKADWPSQRPSFLERTWKTVVAWVAHRGTGARG